MDRLGTEVWCRLRLGIGEPFGAKTSYVLGRFAGTEQPVVERAVDRAADAIECWLAHGVDLAMTRYNGTLPEA